MYQYSLYSVVSSIFVEHQVFFFKPYVVELIPEIKHISVILKYNIWYISYCIYKNIAYEFLYR